MSGNQIIKFSALSSDSQKANSLPSSFDEKSKAQAIIGALKPMAAIMVASGKLDATSAKAACSALASKLTSYPDNLIVDALNEHERASPFFPALSDVVIRIEKMLEKEYRAKYHEKYRALKAAHTTKPIATDVQKTEQTHASEYDLDESQYNLDKSNSIELDNGDILFKLPRNRI